MQVPPRPACSLSYLWETKKVLDMNMVSDCCTSSKSTSAMVHCSKRGSSSFLSPSNMPYTASTPSAKLPSAREDTHSLLEKHMSKVSMSQKIILFPKPQPSGTLPWVLFSQGSKAIIPAFTAPWDVQLQFIIGIPQPSPTTLRRGQWAQPARERKSISARVGSKVQAFQDQHENSGKGQCRGLSYPDCERDLERQRDRQVLEQNSSAWVLRSALHSAPWEDEVSACSRPQYSLISLACHLSYSMTPEGRSECRVCRKGGLSINLQCGNVTTEREEQKSFSPRACWTAFGQRTLPSLEF